MFNSYAENTLRHAAALCDGCGICISVCPHAVFAREGRAVRVARAEACMECGACQRNCPAGAIAVESGVGCAAAMIGAALRGQKEATCGGSCGCGSGADDFVPRFAAGERNGLISLPIASCCGGGAEGARELTASGQSGRTDESRRSG